MHKPIRFTDLGLSFPHKLCFADFNEQIHHGARIGIIGRNGIGKSTLLKIIQGTWTAFSGSVSLPSDVQLGYLPQIIEHTGNCSGGESLNHALTQALCCDPNVLLLDEPTNHLDKTNRRSLMRHLCHYPGTLIMVTHDVELLRNSVDTLWHIHAGKIAVFHGNYEDFQRQLSHKKEQLEKERDKLQQEKKTAHLSLMKTQERNKNLRQKGEKSIEQRKWPTIRSKTSFASGITTGDKRLHQIREKQAFLQEELSALYQPETIEMHFQIPQDPNPKTLITITEGSIAFTQHPSDSPFLSNLNFHLQSAERVSLYGDNGSGKSTFIKALLNQAGLYKAGQWVAPQASTIGYLDQHYQTLHPELSAFDMVASYMPGANHQEIRKHLNTFLFRKNEEVDTLIKHLSGGERLRLSLCCIAAKPPALLILDEVTNNLDLETKAHVRQVVADFPGALIVISHDSDFLQAIHIQTSYLFKAGSMHREE